MIESEAVKKWCPLGDSFCKAQDCMMWVETLSVGKCLQCGAEYTNKTSCYVCKTQLDPVKSGSCWLTQKRTEEQPFKICQH